MQEHRQSKRLPLELHGTCGLYVGDDQRHVLVTNISHEGLGLCSETALPTGHPLRLQIDVPDQVGPVRLEIVLNWIMPVDTAQGYTFAAGGTIVDIKPQERTLLLEHGREAWQLRHD